MTQEPPPRTKIDRYLTPPLIAACTLLFLLLLPLLPGGFVVPVLVAAAVGVGGERGAGDAAGQRAAGFADGAAALGAGGAACG